MVATEAVLRSTPKKPVNHIRAARNEVGRLIYHVPTAHPPQWRMGFVAGVNAALAILNRRVRKASDGGAR